MQVILDSSFARPGSAPIWGGKKGEFRDWTRFTGNKIGISRFTKKMAYFDTNLRNLGRVLVLRAAKRNSSKNMKRDA